MIDNHALAVFPRVRRKSVWRYSLCHGSEDTALLTGTLTSSQSQQIRKPEFTLGSPDSRPRAQQPSAAMSLLPSVC